MIETGINHIIKKELENSLNSENPLWFHFDVDVIDPSLIPVLIPTSNGLTLNKLKIS